MTSYLYIAGIAAYLSSLPAIPLSFAMACGMLVAGSACGVCLRVAARGTVVTNAVELLVFISMAGALGHDVDDVAATIALVSMFAPFGYCEPEANRWGRSATYHAGILALLAMETWYTVFEHVFCLVLAVFVFLGRTAPVVPFGAEYALVLWGIVSMFILLRFPALSDNSPIVIPDRPLEDDAEGERAPVLVHPYVAEVRADRDDQAEAEAEAGGGGGGVSASRGRSCVRLNWPAAVPGAFVFLDGIAACTVAYSTMMLVFASARVPIGLLIPIFVVMAIASVLSTHTPAYRLPTLIRSPAYLSALAVVALAAALLLAGLAPEHAVFGHVCVLLVLRPLSRVAARDALSREEVHAPAAAPTRDVLIAHAWARYSASHLASMAGRLVAVVVALLVNVYAGGEGAMVLVPTAVLYAALVPLLLSRRSAGLFLAAEYQAEMSLPAEPDGDGDGDGDGDDRFALGEDDMS